MRACLMHASCEMRKQTLMRKLIGLTKLFALAKQMLMRTLIRGVETVRQYKSRESEREGRDPG